jgi:hypothetical protein
MQRLCHSDTVSTTITLDDGTTYFFGEKHNHVVRHPDGTQEPIEITHPAVQALIELEEDPAFVGYAIDRAMTAAEEREHDAARGR